MFTALKLSQASVRVSQLKAGPTDSVDFKDAAQSQNMVSQSYVWTVKTLACNKLIVSGQLHDAI